MTDSPIAQNSWLIADSCLLTVVLVVQECDATKAL